MKRKFANYRLVLLWLVAALAASSQPSSLAADKFPTTVLWAWQRPENLLWLDTKRFAVAFLACHAVVSGDTVIEHWREQPLRVPIKTRIIAVVRIETDRKSSPSLGPEQAKKLAAIIDRVSTMPRVEEVQIDFDALESQRKFYTALLTQVRSQLPKSMPISITALASWCLYDNWIQTLPVDETVPMMFSLGSERPKILLYFESNKDFLVPRCCKSLGISLEDAEVNKLMIPLTRQRKIPVRVYVFTKTAWTKSKVHALEALLDGVDDAAKRENRKAYEK